MTAISYTVHYRLPEDGKRYDLWVKTESGWEKAGQHRGRQAICCSPSDRETVTFCVQERTAVLAVGLAGSSDPFGSNAGGDPDPQKAGPAQTIRSRLRKARQKKS